MTWPCQNTNELREFFDMKKKGVGSPAYKHGIHIKDYREQKNGRKLLWRIKLKLTRNEYRKLKLAMCI